MSKLITLVLMTLGAASLAHARSNHNILDAFGNRSVIKEGQLAGGGRCMVAICVQNGRAIGIEGVRGHFIGKGDACSERRVMGESYSITLADTDVITERPSKVVLSYGSTAGQHYHPASAGPNAVKDGALWIEPTTMVPRNSSTGVNAVKFRFMDFTKEQIFSCTVPVQ